MVSETVRSRILKDTLHPALCSLDLPDSENLSENREESQIAEPLCTDGATLDEPDAQNAQCTPYAPGTCKSTCENQLTNVEL